MRLKRVRAVLALGVAGVLAAGCGSAEADDPGLTVAASPSAAPAGVEATSTPKAKPSNTKRICKKAEKEFKAGFGAIDNELRTHVAKLRKIAKRATDAELKKALIQAAKLEKNSDIEKMDEKKALQYMEETTRVHLRLRKLCGRSIIGVPGQ